MKIDTLVIASTNPANYKGVSDIKEPLLDRMEQIDMGPPESIEQEIAIGLRNMALDGSIIPEWHLKIIASAIRCMRSSNCRYSARIEVEPSCRATIKAYDHVAASAIRNGRKAVMFADYGRDFANLSLALKSRFEVDYEDELSKDEVVREVVNDAIDTVCGEIYAAIPRSIFGGMMEELSEIGELNVYSGNGVEKYKNLWAFVSSISRRKEEVNSALEITLESIARCTGLVEKQEEGVYVYLPTTDKPECSLCQRSESGLEKIAEDLLYSLFNPYHRDSGDFDVTELIKKHLKPDMAKDFEMYSSVFKDLMKTFGFMRPSKRRGKSSKTC